MIILFRMVKEWQLLLLSLSIFTHLPISRSIPNNTNRVIESYKYCGVSGLLIGAFSALTYWCFVLYVSNYYAILASLLVSFLGMRVYQGNGFVKKTHQNLPHPDRTRVERAKTQATRMTGLLGLFFIKYILLMKMVEVPSALILSHFLSYSMVFSIIYTHSYYNKEKLWRKETEVNDERKDDVIIWMFIIMTVLFLNSVSKLSCILLLAVILTSKAIFYLMDKKLFFKGKFAINIAQSITEIVCYITIDAVTI